jgi:hypothetical protein
MSGNQTSKPMPKPLKGQAQGYGIGDFSDLTSAKMSIPGMLENGVMTNIELEDSVINNTTIGVDVPNIGIFTNLTVTGNVIFTGFGNLYWDALTGILTIDASIEVTGCSLLGNLKICVNTIKANNLNGGINLVVDGFGTLNFQGPITHTASFGNYLSNVISGNHVTNVLKEIKYTSYDSFYSLTTLKDQVLNTLNGDIILKTEASMKSVLITSFIQTQGSIIVTTSTNHNVILGDIINVTQGSSNPVINGTVGIFTVLSPVSFLISGGPTILASGTASFLKIPDSSIYLTPKTAVVIPIDIPVTFGPSSNNVLGNTNGLALSSDTSITLNSGITYVPVESELSFGTDGALLTSSTTNGSTLLVKGDSLQINSSYANFYTPIPTLGDYTSNLADPTDRGIQFDYWSPSNNVPQLGWFGYKKELDAFTIITNATNTNNVITGTPAGLYVDNITVNRVVFTSLGNLNMGCNDIININTLTGCEGVLNVNGTNGVYITGQTVGISGSNINITPTTKLTFPDNIPFNFGTSSTLINTTSGLVLGTSVGNILMNSPIVFDGTTGNYKLYASAGTLVLSSSVGNFHISGGNLTLNPNNSLVLSSSGSITGNTSGIFISSGNTTFNSGSNIQLGNNTSLLFSTSGNVTGNTGGLYLSSGNVSINNGSLFHLGSSTVLFSNTSGTYTTSGGFFMNNELCFGGTNACIDYTGGSNGSFTLTGNSYNSLIFNAWNNLQTNAPLYFGSSSASIYSTSGGIVIHGGNILLDGTLVLNNGILALGASNTTGDTGILGQYTINTTGPFNTFFGYQTATDSFVFYSQAIVNNQTVSGTLGNITANGYNISGGGTLTQSGYNVNCGTLGNVALITGCSGTLNIKAGTAVNVTSDSLALSKDTVVSFATSGSIYNTLGNLFLNTNKVIVNGDLQVNGTTSNVYSTVTNLMDPIFSLGGVTGPLVNDLKDRGIEFKYYTSSTKTGFIGYKNSLDRVVVIKDGINTNEIFSGAYSDFQIGDLYATNITLNNGTNPSVISSTTSLYFSTNTTVFNGSINISQASFYTSNGNLIVSNTSGCVIFDTDCIEIGDTTLQSSNGNFTISSGNSITLYSSTGNINIYPQNGNTWISQTFMSEGNFFGLSGNTANSLISSNGNLTINGLNSIILNTPTTVITGDIYNPGLNLLKADLNKYILPLGTFQRVNVTDISNTTTTGKLVVTLSSNPYLVSGDSIDIYNSFISDGTFTVQDILSPTTFTILHSNLSTSATTGVMQSLLTVNQGKDVGIRVDYWTTTGNTLATSGSVNYNSGFFGFKYDTRNWTFYNDSIITSDVVVSGTLGNILVSKVNTSNISGYTLDGTLSAGSSLIAGNNFHVLGGTIQNTPIGNTTASTIRGTAITNTLSASLLNLTAASNMNYSVERFTLSSGTPTGSPSANTVVTFVSVNGVSFTSSGTMGSTGLTDGAIKVIICASMGVNCLYKLAFGAGKLTTPNPCGTTGSTLITMKHTGQGVQLIWNGSSNSWFCMNSGVFVS